MSGLRCAVCDQELLSLAKGKLSPPHLPTRREPLTLVRSDVWTRLILVVKRLFWKALDCDGSAVLHC